MFVGWIFLQILAFANCVSDEDFFPFGESAGDLKLPARKHAFGKVLMLNGTYSFYNTGHKQLQVYGDGIITLGKSSLSHTALKHRKFPFPPNTPSVAVFYAPIEVGKLSEVFHRETRNESVLKKATDHVRWSFTREQDFVASSVFIATWKNVIHADNRLPSKSNTFQVVLITDGQRTFSLFNYKDNGLQWIKGYHVQYQGFRFFDAQVGFSAGDQVR
ncbi:unnamed protein product [Porites lobata]|uniref:NIDO domain-containing protein n=1 Tax=Porites lobata TaxID=104759 RepID=A0ABN8NQ85_9CNID|nr:unnamed protein product [Porites lobata]